MGAWVLKLGASVWKWLQPIFSDKRIARRKRFAERLEELEGAAKAFHSAALRHQLGRWIGEADASREAIIELHLQFSAIAIKVEHFLSVDKQGELRRAMREFTDRIYGDTHLILVAEDAVKGAPERRLRDAESIFCNHLDSLHTAGPSWEADA